MEMTIDISDERHNANLEEFARSRLELVVGRFRERLSRIEVRIRDENTNNRGLDKTCSIDVHMVPRRSLHVHATEVNFHDAVLKAIHRLETVIAKTVDRSHCGNSIRHHHGGVKNDSRRVTEELTSNDDWPAP